MLCITMVVSILRTNSHTSFFIQPEKFKLSLQHYLYVYIMFTEQALKYVELLLNKVY